MSASSEKRDSVTFIDTQRRYTPGREQCFVFTRCPELVPAARDWVGLFRVGWLSRRDYYTFVWAPTPSQKRLDLTYAVTFAGKQLPPEDGYFYQVCYTSRDGTVRGASGPFQFCQPATSIGPVDDLELEREARMRELSTQLGQRAAAHVAELEEKQKSISELENQLQAAHENVKREHDAMRELMPIKPSEEGQIQLLQRKLEENQVRLVAYQGETSDLVQELKVKAARVGELEGVLRQREARVRELSTQLTQRTAAHGTELEEKQKLISDLENQLQAAHENIKREQDAMRELMAIKASEEGQIQLLVQELKVKEAQIGNLMHSMAIKASKEGQIQLLVQELKVKEAQIGNLMHSAKSHSEEILIFVCIAFDCAWWNIHVVQQTLFHPASYHTHLSMFRQNYNMYESLRQSELSL